MPRKSSVFIEGQRITESMLVITGQYYPGSWRSVNVRCDCGKYVVLSYSQVYYGTRYSCGCTRRPRVDSINYEGVTVSSARGNMNSGRSLIVLSRDPATAQWSYVCECCAVTFVMPLGMERGMLRSLRDIAGQHCPNYRPYVEVDNIVRLTNKLMEIGYRIPGDWKVDIALNLAAYYQKKFIKYSKIGDIQGFYGLPDLSWLPRSWRVTEPARTVAEGLRVED